MAHFADIQNRLNTAVLSHLSDGMATVGNQTLQCVFDDAYSLAGAGPVGFASTQPRITCATASLPANPVGQAVSVAGGSYVVAEHQPDGTGISVLLLEAA